MSLLAHHHLGHSTFHVKLSRSPAAAPAQQTCHPHGLKCQRLLCLRSAFLPPILLFPWKSTPFASHAAVLPRCCASLQALILDCDGVILESEDLHRRAYNATFSHFNVCCPGSSETLQWSSEFYDQLQNQIGGGKPKMRWYFKTYGWPTSSLGTSPPEGDNEMEELIDTLQDWKTEKYKDIIASGEVKPRPGILSLMDEAEKHNVKLAICSAATKSSVVFCLSNLLGTERLEKLDCFLAGDDVERKKPDPSIYIEAVKRLCVAPEHCLVIEDSVIGLQAALGAGLKCIISYTSSTANQDFKRAVGVYPDLGKVRLQHLKAIMEKAFSRA